MNKILIIIAIAGFVLFNVAGQYIELPTFTLPSFDLASMLPDWLTLKDVAP